jgi:hypothetical protein
VRAIKYINEYVHQGLWRESFDNWSCVQETLARTDQEIRTLIGEDTLSAVTDFDTFGEDSDLSEW